LVRAEVWMAGGGMAGVLWVVVGMVGGALLER
jgi:hypothetical protein